MKTRIKIIISLLLGYLSYGQQEAQFTNYMYNTINVNPAYAGSRGVMSIFGLYRTQWVGLEGAPDTGTFSINTPFENSRLGLGVSFINDRIGPTTTNNISVDVSYSIPTSETWKMSFGVKGSASLFSLDPNKLTYVAGDPNLTPINNDLTPNVGAGVYFHNDKTYVGFSIPYMLQTTRYNDNSRAVYMERMHYYLIAGHVFDLSSNVKFKPAILGKATEGAPIAVDATANFMFNEKFILGGAYRWSAAWSALAGFQVNNNLFIGYGYDRETTKLQRYNSGSHEIFLRYEFAKKNDRIISPRFF